MSRPAPVAVSTLLLLLVARASDAAPPPDRAPGRKDASRGRVELVVAAAPEEVPRLEAPLRDLLAAKGLELQAERRPAIPPATVATAAAPSSPESVAGTVARVFVDLTAADSATLYLVDPRRGRVHVRRVPLEQGFDPVARAGTLFIIEQSIDAMIDAILAGQEIGVSREEYERTVAAAQPPSAQEAAPEPERPPRRPSDVPSSAVSQVVSAPSAAGTGAERRLRIAGGYEGATMGQGRYRHAARLVLALGFARLQLAIGARLAAPVALAGQGAEARLWSGGADVSAGMRFPLASNLSIAAVLGFGGDLTRVAPSVIDAALEPSTPFWAATPSARAAVELERVFARRFTVALTLGAEARLLAERYTVRSGLDAGDVFVPRRVWPLAALLFGTSF